MSSTSDSTKAYKIVDVPYFRRSHNPLEIASVTSLWETGLQPVQQVQQAQQVGNPRHEITFGFLGAVTNQRRTKIETTIKEWERYAHVSFVYKADITEATIRISFEEGNGNWSEVGAQIAFNTDHNVKTMNLAGVEPNGAEASNYERHVILHEFGHSLGLLHEHQSPAREGVINNIEAACAMYRQRGGSWTDGVVHENIRLQNHPSMIISYSKLDPESVMMYATNDGENINSQLKHELSEMDKAFMVINYPRSGARINEGGVDDSVWTMEHALDVAGITEPRWHEERQSILTRYANLNAVTTGEIREIFGIWTKERRKEEMMARAATAVAAAAAALADATAFAAAAAAVVA